MLVKLRPFFPSGSGCAKSECGAHAVIALGCEQAQLTAKRVPSDGNAVSVNSRQVLQERQTGDHVIQVVGIEQTKLQILSSFFAVCHFFTPQKFLHEIALICGESLPASKKVKEGIAMLDEYWTKSFRCLGERERTGMHGVGTAGDVIEQHHWKRATILW